MCILDVQHARNPNNSYSAVWDFTLLAKLFMTNLVGRHFRVPITCNILPSGPLWYNLLKGRCGVYIYNEERSK